MAPDVKVAPAIAARTAALALAIMGLSTACAAPPAERSAGQDTLQIIQAAVTWADSSTVREHAGPLVILERVSPHAPRSVYGGMVRVENASLPLTAALNPLPSAGNVMVCQAPRGPRSERLCEREPPWRVVQFGIPMITGDTAAVPISMLPVRREYGGGVSYILVFVRADRAWQIVRARASGEID